MFVCVWVHLGLENSIEKYCQASSTSWDRGSRKLLILVPLNANISHKLGDEDDNISLCGNLPEVKIDRAGVKDRVYKHSVYKVQDEYGKVGGVIK